MPNILINFTTDQARWLRSQSKFSAETVNEIVRQRVSCAMPPQKSTKEPHKIDPDKPIYQDVYRAKWMYDGSTTIREMVERHHQRIAYLEALEKENVMLEQPVQDDYAFLITQDAKVAKRRKFERLEAEGDAGSSSGR